MQKQSDDVEKGADRYQVESSFKQEKGKQLKEQDSNSESQAEKKAENKYVRRAKIVFRMLLLTNDLVSDFLLTTSILASGAALPCNTQVIVAIPLSIVILVWCICSFPYEVIFHLKEFNVITLDNYPRWKAAVSEHYNMYFIVAQLILEDLVSLSIAGTIMMNVGRLSEIPPLYIFTIMSSCASILFALATKIKPLWQGNYSRAFKIITPLFIAAAAAGCTIKFWMAIPGSKYYSVAEFNEMETNNFVYETQVNNEEYAMSTNGDACYYAQTPSDAANYAVYTRNMPNTFLCRVQSSDNKYVVTFGGNQCVEFDMEVIAADHLKFTFADIGTTIDYPMYSAGYLHFEFADATSCNLQQVDIVCNDVSNGVCSQWNQDKFGGYPYDFGNNYFQASDSYLKIPFSQNVCIME